MTGLKGDPGESISLPQVIISPNTQTVTENQTATFYCSASGNPKPTVSWSKVNSSLKERRMINGGRLQVIRSTFNDSGDFMCTAANILGRAEATANLVVEGKLGLSTIWFILICAFSIACPKVRGV